MFKCAIHLTDRRPSPPDEPFVFDPTVHDIKTLTGGIVSDVVAGGHMTFAMTVGGRKVVPPDEIPLTDVLWNLPDLTDVLDNGQPSEAKLVFHDQSGLRLTLTFVMAGEDVLISVENPSGEFVSGGTAPPRKRMTRAILADELRQVAGAVLRAGAAIGSEFAAHPLVRTWAKRVKIPPAEVA